jgi:hypothetical protein
MAAARRQRIPQTLPARQRHCRIDPRLQRARSPRALERGQVRPAPHIVHGRDALLRHVLHRRRERPIEQLRCRLRLDPSHERHRVVLQHAGRLTAAVTHDLAAGDLGRGARHPRGSQRRRVRQRHVAVQPVHEYGMVRRDGVDPLPARQLAAPVLVVPVATRNPRSGRHGTRERSDARDELLRRPRVPQLYGSETETAVDEMHVRIDEPGHDHAIGHVDDARVRPDELADLRFRPDGRDAVATDRDGLGRRRAAHAGPRGADEYEVGERSGTVAGGRRTASQRGGQHESSKHHAVHVGSWNG